MLDHRDVARDLDLFHIQEEAPGSIFWHENGWFIYNQIKDYMRKLQIKNGYREVNTPQMVDRSLWERSGHWENYSHNMFCVEANGEESRYALKPMNCACHIQIYNKKVISYRDLPIRYAEFGACMRNEPSGSLSGIMRVRSFVQDDAHIFCMESQIEQEVVAFSKMAKHVYDEFGFSDISVKFSTRPEKYSGSDEQWKKAEEALDRACQAAGLQYDIQPGEGAFYGPKLEFMIKDRNGKEWQCGTIQVDFVLPERLDAKFTDSDGIIKQPVILHRAILGSFERFIGILLENFGYELPSWLNPRCLAILDISDSGFDVQNIELFTEHHNYTIDRSKDNLRALIKKYSEMKYRYICVYGNKEVGASSLPINVLGGSKQNILIKDLFEFIKNSS